MTLETCWKRRRKILIVYLSISILTFLLNGVLLFFKFNSDQISLIIFFSSFVILFSIILIIIIKIKPLSYIFSNEEITIIKNNNVIRIIKLTNLDYLRYGGNLIKIKEFNNDTVVLIKTYKKSIQNFKDFYLEALTEDLELKKKSNRKKKKYLITYGVSLSFIVVYFCLMIFTNHGAKYTGDYPELYTIAINNLIGARGYAGNGEVTYNSSIQIIEEDDYGRKMFSYHEGNMTKGYSLLISQSSDENSVYYLPNYNFISKTYIRYEEDYQKYFSNNEISDFKTINNWNQEINLSICIKQEIIKKKPKPEVKISAQTFKELLKKYAISLGYKGKDSLYRFSIYAVSDDYQRSLYYVYGVEDDLKKQYNVLMIFNQDGSYDENVSVVGFPDFNNYNKLLKDFKEANGWNTPNNM